MEEWIRERFELAAERVTQIISETVPPEPFADFFRREAAFLTLAAGLPQAAFPLPGGSSRSAPADDGTIPEPADKESPFRALSLEECKERNRILYEDLLPENYGKCYGNPAWAESRLGGYGPLFSFLYRELSGITGFAAENDMEAVTILLELFLGIHSSFCQEELPSPEQVRADLLSYIMDYCQDMVEAHVRRSLDPEEDFALRIVMEADLSDPVYLYRYGEYVSGDELETAVFLASLPEEEIRRMARTLTSGFEQGFVIGRKDLKKKKTVQLRYHLGFERLVRAVVEEFARMGLKAVLPRRPLQAVCVSPRGVAGYVGGMPNPQFAYDHQQDDALFLSEDFVSRKLRAVQTAYEKYKALCAVYAGPVVIETFGEPLFTPAACPQALRPGPEQQRLRTRLTDESARIANRYILPQERSFSIIAWPLPSIGPAYREIFAGITRINTLDSDKYSQIQQLLIDRLDTCEWVQIQGADGNETDLIIHLHELKHPIRQTNFENCVADLNIPVGEVFTSPMLAGTGGVLHVSGVYLGGLYFRNLKLVFDCGQVIDYSCDNFESEEENRHYIEDNILFHHPRIAMGEFAIGTNTAAYALARRFGIADRLPILIAEKMGPHFAVGDTCYSREEDHKVYNPDGKEIIARDNEISALRNEDPALAYFNCHTDITLPYEELGSISVIDDEGESHPLLLNGRFVLPGTEELNEPLIEQLTQ